MRFPHRLATATLGIVMLAACTAPTATGEPTGASPSPQTTAPTTASATPSQTDPTEEPTPPGGRGEFTCDLPITEDATVAIANIVDVRVGTHPGYDRVAFEFTGGIPEAAVERAEPPFTEDGSGFPVDVEGDSFLRLTMRGGTKQTDAGTSSYDGPTDFDPDFPVLVDLVEGGDFERQSIWYIGLSESSDVCVRVFTLDDAPRLVIDIEH